MSLLSKYLPGLEGIVDGNKRIEHELVYHAILEDMSVLNTAVKKELQEQWEIKVKKTDASITPKNLAGGRLRVRNINNGEKYVFCSKAKAETGDTEVELESTKDQFDQFAAMATGGMIKTRYYFPIKGTENSFPEGDFNGALVWEIDVFKDGVTGEPVEWVKIDLELPSNFDSDIPKFPFATKQIITSQYPNRPENEEAIVSNLYDEKYVLRH
jgi:hypothetical protein